MLQINSTLRFEDVGAALSAASHHHGASILAVTDIGKLLHPNQRAAAHDAQVFTICQTELYSVLINADIRFAAILPCRIAAIRQPTGLTLQALSPKEFCDEIHRPDLDKLAGPMETVIRRIMEEAATSATRVSVAAVVHGASSPGALEGQMNMRGAIPQRIDGHGTKVEDLGGTGAMDAPGG